MKVIVKTDEYTVFQKRSGRYAVRDGDRAWVNGDAKVAILLAHKLIEAPLPGAQESGKAGAGEAEAPETEAAKTAESSEEASSEADAEAAGASEAPEDEAADADKA